MEESNLRDQYDYTAQGEGPDSWKVLSLWIFPIKSCHGIELKESRVVSTGLEHDRQYTFAEKRFNSETGKGGWVFITQRQYPALARVTTQFKTQKDRAGGRVLEVGYPVKTWLNRWISMIGETRKTFELPLEASEEELASYPLEPVRIWKDVVMACNMTVLVPSDFAQSFGAQYPIALFRLPPSHFREVFRCSPRKAEIRYQPVIAFADACPIHLINLASVRDLNSRIEGSIPKLDVIRFRPNDSWNRILLGDKEYYTSCRKVRCKMPNVDQDTGARHPAEPYSTMRKYRCIGEGNKLNPCLGMQVVPAAEMGVIRVGDSMRVLETREHYYIDQ
ncbi:hypothetical protein EV426DRAFT_667834 [Tirmania nivea]|nr:hypothetical protein EV426DRAFT_667834 [Tirmania nivea]